MPFADIILVAIMGLFVLFGLFFGLVHTLGSMTGTILGIVLATRLVEPAFAKFGFLFGGGGIAKVVVFMIVFLLVSRFVGIALWVVEKAFGFFANIPFARSANRLLGGIFGFVEGVVVVGVASYFAMLYLPDGAIRAALESSSLASYLIATMTTFQFLFPESLRIVK